MNNESEMPTDTEQMPDTGTGGAVQPPPMSDPLPPTRVPRGRMKQPTKDQLRLNLEMLAADLKVATYEVNRGRAEIKRLRDRLHAASAIAAVLAVCLGALLLR